MTLEVDTLVRTAHAAYELGGLASPVERAGWIDAVAAALEGQAHRLVPLAGTETHLPEGRLTGELARTVFQLRLLAMETKSGEYLDATVDHVDETWGMGPRPDLRRHNVPLGVAGVFGASNFPFAFSVAGGDTASALSAGCAVVHKIHEAHPKLGALTGAIVTNALHEAGAPSGLFAVVSGRNAGSQLVDHPLVQAIGFTGSRAVGRLLFDRAQARPEPIPFYGELSSINPVFVTERAWSMRRDEILNQYVNSVTMGMGQFCTKPGVLLVPGLDESSVDLINARAAEAARFPMLSRGLATGFHDALGAIAGCEAVEVLVTGDDSDATGPTILRTTAEAVLAEPGLLHREMFGPASLVVEYGSESALPILAAGFEGQLTCTIHAEEGDAISGLLSVLGDLAGRVIWNGWPTGVTVSYAQQHGGPHPATTAPGTTSVGTAAIRRFTRAVAYQGFPDAHLPPALQEGNPWGIARRVDGQWVRSQPEPPR